MIGSASCGDAFSFKTIPGSAICGDANHGQDDVRLGLLRRCQSTIKMIPARPIVASQSSVKTVLGLVYCGDGFPTDEVTIGSAYCGDVITFCGTAGSDVANFVVFAMV